MSRIYRALSQSDAADLQSGIESIDLGQPHGTDYEITDDVNIEQHGAGNGAHDWTMGDEYLVLGRDAHGEYRTVNTRFSDAVHVFPFGNANPRAAEQYRILRTNVLQHPLKPQVLAVSSPGSGDGKTLTAINLGSALALKAEGRVLIVDGDLRKCSIAGTLGLDVFRGLSEVIPAACSLEDAIVRVQELPNLYILPSGQVTENPAELLDCEGFRSLVGTLRRQFSYIVFDTTPISAVADFKLVQQVVDGVLLVARPDYTKRRALMKAIASDAQQKLLGIVINGFEDWFLWSGTGPEYDYAGGKSGKSASKE